MYIPFPFKRTRQFHSTLPPSGSSSTTPPSPSPLPLPPLEEQDKRKRTSHRSSARMWGTTRLPFSALVLKKSPSTATGSTTKSKQVPSSSQPQQTHNPNPPPNPTRKSTTAAGLAYPEPIPEHHLEKERRWEGISKRDVMTRAGVEYLIKKLEPIERWQAAHAGALGGAEERRDGEQDEEGHRQKQQRDVLRMAQFEVETLQTALAASNLGYEIG